MRTGARVSCWRDAHARLAIFTAAARVVQYSEDGFPVAFLCVPERGSLNIERARVRKGKKREKCIDARQTNSIDRRDEVRRKRRRVSFDDWVEGHGDRDGEMRRSLWGSVVLIWNRIFRTDAGGSWGKVYFVIRTNKRDWFETVFSDKNYYLTVWLKYNTDLIAKKVISK